MANKQHLAIINQSVKVWNDWRKSKPDIKPDLCRADLHRADLSGANLRHADLYDTTLIGANLRCADLRGADLRGASFYNARLSSANFSGAVLCSSKLSGTDLSGADLIAVDLSNANLFSANLSGAHLKGANLRGADLSRANLSYAGLRDSILKGANLVSAILSSADLRGTDFSSARLQGAIFNGADLQDAKFARASMSQTIMADINFSNAKGLEEVWHEGPSTLGYDTIRDSNGNLPEVFLRGCGISDWEIEAAKLYMPNLPLGRASEILYKVHELRLNPAFQFHSCFISYSTQDHSFAETLYKDLQHRGVRCWFAPEDMKIGDKLRPRIDESIRVHDKLLLVLSKHSTSSQWVEQEVETALNKEREQGRAVLFPIRLDASVIENKTGWPALVRNTRHIGDFSKWEDHDSYRKAFERLLRDLKADNMA
jgi:uncharacterized protein YjbI with pentapeptide repeats